VREDDSRIASPFAFRLPEVPDVVRHRGLFRVRTAGGPLARLSFVIGLSRSNEAIVWGDCDGWRERVRNRSHSAFSVGYQRTGSDEPRSVRLSLELNGDDETWGRNAIASRDGELRWLQAHGYAERDGLLAKRAVVWSAEANYGAARTRYHANSGRRISTRGWFALTGGLSTRSNSSARLRRSGPDMDVAAGFVLRGGRSGQLRWQGTCGWRTLVGVGSFGAGLGGGGEGRRQLLAPWVACDFERNESDRIRMEIGPRITFADAVAREDEDPAGEFGRGIAIAKPRSPAILDPASRPQREWPRAEIHFDHIRRGLQLSVSLSVARLDDAFDWRPVNDTSSPVIYTPVSAPSRTCARAALRAELPLGRSVIVRSRFVGSRESGSDNGRRLLFVPLYEWVAAASYQHGPWFANLAGHLRGRSAAGAGDAHTPAWVDFSACAGVRFASGRISLTIENLLAERKVIRPDEVLTGRWLGIEWNHAFPVRSS
jgi:hypothetical protein